MSCIDQEAKNHRSRARLGLLVAITLIATAACSDDDTGADDDRSTTTASSATTTQPSAVDDPDSAFAAVEAVVQEATGLADKMYQDPEGTLDDPDQEDLERYHSLFPEGAETPAGVETQVRNLAAAGQHARASQASGIYRESRLYSFRAIDADMVRFRACSLRDVEVVDAEGNVVSQLAEVEQGDGEARRENGVWKFFGVDPDDTGPLPLTPGAVNSGFCDTVAASTGQVSP